MATCLIDSMRLDLVVSIHGYCMTPDPKLDANDTATLRKSTNDVFLSIEPFDSACGIMPFCSRDNFPNSPSKAEPAFSSNSCSPVSKHHPIG